MPTRKSPRKGSLQFWPRKRAAKKIPSSNWKAIKSDKALKGFICYKAGMMSATVLDNTPNSMLNAKKRVVPVTILECPGMKILSVRFYKDGKVATEVLNDGLEKELKRKVKLPKKHKKFEDIKSEEYDDLRIICYSLVKKTGLKKKPDVLEIGLSGNYESKLAFVKENLTKELNVSDYFEKGELVDLRGITKGKGTQGPVKRFGITLKVRKSEKGRRRPGSIGPWNPSRVIFRVPMAGQLGLFTRIVYNNKIIDIGKEERELKNIKNYGNIKTNFIIVEGSVTGPAKRQVVLTHALRPTRKQLKKNYELEVLQ